MQNTDNRIVQKTLAELEEQVRVFNGTYGIGCKVDIKLDSGEIKAVTVFNKASILSTHSAVGWFEEISGCYSLDRVCDGTFVKDQPSIAISKDELIKQFKEYYDTLINQNARWSYKFQYNQSRFDCIIKNGMIAIIGLQLRYFPNAMPKVDWKEQKPPFDFVLSNIEYEELLKLWCEPVQIY